MERAGRDPRGPGKRLIRDERLRRELELCDRWGIPHSQFRGIGDGRWTERDRQKALAWLDYQKTVCPQCGTRYDDWDHGGDGDKQAELGADGESPHGMKVGLVPVAAKAALDLINDLKRTNRTTDDD